jgi:hypothetical protein
MGVERSSNCRASSATSPPHWCNGTACYLRAGCIVIVNWVNTPNVPTCLQYNCTKFTERFSPQNPAGSCGICLSSPTVLQTDFHETRYHQHAIGDPPISSFPTPTSTWWQHVLLMCGAWKCALSAVKKEETSTAELWNGNIATWRQREIFWCSGGESVVGFT